MKKQFNQLTESLSKIFNWHMSRINCCSNLLLGLISARTVNLTKVVTHFRNNNKIVSNYRRVQSFFKDVIFDYDDLAEYMITHLLSKKDKLCLVLDRTNWQFGKSDINILVLSAVYEGIAVPLYYDFLDHRGNSNSECRINLVQKFITKFGKKRIESILGDREFIGKKWLGWLDSQSIDYVVRIKNNQLATSSNGGEVKVSRLFHDVAIDQHKNIKKENNMVV
jgi:hypothetical protein